jgi:hypothetical protein|tara:strand:+ start:538 stop:825 length:288 start_codon:yes stop_codon:yes gene_type:complete
MGYIQSQLIRDLASLNKMEMLCWDSWGISVSNASKNSASNELNLLDQVARLTQADDDRFQEMRILYENEECLKIPQVIQSFSPELGNQNITIRSE